METPSQKVYFNASMHQKFVDTMRNENSDVNFIFESENDIVKIPANKDVLAASSPVFNIMFNGDLKEEGDVKIVDASPAAFEEFLQFFYGHQVKPTMENIAEVLKLADKYDVAGCLPICLAFLKDNLTLDDILWGLHLAIKYRVHELQIFCNDKIQANLKDVLEVINLNKTGKLELTSNSKNLSEEDLESILPHIFDMVKNAFSHQSVELDRFREKRIFPICLNRKPKEYGYESITEIEMIKFKLTGTMLLTNIVLERVYRHVNLSNSYRVFPCDCEVIIEKLGGGNVFSTKIELKEDGCCIILPKTVCIEQNRTYAIIIRFPLFDAMYFTKKANVPKEPIEFAPQISISFSKDSGHYTHSLVSRLYFEQEAPN